MTHVKGHVESPARSFGVLYPQLSKPTDKKIGIYDIKDDGTVLFPILFVPSNEEKGGFKASKTLNAEVGFHPYLIPWDAGDSKFLVIATDLAKWPDHEHAEKEMLKKVKSSSKFKAYHSATKVEELHDEFGEIVLDYYNDPSFSTEQRGVLKQTLKYMQTSNFKTIYFSKDKLKTSDEVVQWIVENTVPLTQTGFKFEGNELFYKP